MQYQKGNVVAGLLYTVLGLGVFAAWITHLVVCFQGAKWGFLIAGAIFFPIGLVHGFGCWFDWW